MNSSNNCIDIGTCAKTMNFKGIGRNKLYEFLRNEKYLMHNNIPYQKTIDLEWFRVITQQYSVPSTGQVKTFLKTLVTQKGMKAISRQLAKHGYKKAK